MLSVFYFTLCAALVVKASPSHIEVSTSLGEIRGVKLKSRLGEEFNAFRGIRYAKNPIGELRFKNPQPVESWKPTVFDATKDGPRCPQGRFDSPDNSEDCLRLNIYSKNLCSNASKPVVVFLHPGGLYGSSGRTNNAGPELLMDRDIVLVTINYRLGTLGFLAAGIAEAPGNAGLKDQVIALRWIRDHIRNFGGDPNSVTLLGYSAGSRCASLHMVSPMSKGLFHKVIAMSGSPFQMEKYNEDQLDLAKKQAKLVNCPIDDKNGMVKCLQETSAEEIIKTTDNMFEIGFYPLLNWSPVIEKDFGQERFLTEDPLKSFEKGDFQKIPLIIGRNKDEFARIAYYNLMDSNITKQMNENWKKVSPIMLRYERNTNDSKEISNLLRAAYEIDKQIVTNSTPFEPFAKLLSDAIIGFPVHRQVNLLAKYIPVYYYCFTYKGRFSDFKFPDDTAYGSVHHDELLYLFNIPRLAPLYSEMDPENKIVERLTRMWTQFAKTGNPNNSKDEYLKNLNWKPFNSDDENYLEIGDELVLDEQLFVRRMSIWEIILATIS
ncbi:juvenile hormone esterase-like [Episyrphus balteatus]|uniref:juvenile hormone esterase-like n=1 Tax=Episyrphus balteatus TaxID=286459 RepID=UPI00248643AA|nr:juvenile hormone esterase-like [Episyrphus balteatus]